MRGKIDKELKVMTRVFGDAVADSIVKVLSNSNQSLGEAALSIERSTRVDPERVASVRARLAKKVK